MLLQAGRRSGIRAAAWLLACLAVLTLAGCGTDMQSQEETSDPAPAQPPPGSDNSTPLIGGTPPTSIAAGTGYIFQPMAQDADGDELFFQVSGQPAWMGFDAASGTLTGTPG